MHRLAFLACLHLILYYNCIIYFVQVVGILLICLTTLPSLSHSSSIWLVCFYVGSAKGTLDKWLTCRNGMTESFYSNVCLNNFLSILFCTVLDVVTTSFESGAMISQCWCCGRLPLAACCIWLYTEIENGQVVFECRSFCRNLCIDLPVDLPVDPGVEDRRSNHGFRCT